MNSFKLLLLIADMLFVTCKIVHVGTALCISFSTDLKERNKRKDKLARNFTEGWVEFNSKRVAKDVASNLNLTQVGGKKRAKSHDVIWNIKYLPG